MINLKVYVLFLRYAAYRGCGQTNSLPDVFDLAYVDACLWTDQYRQAEDIPYTYRMTLKNTSSKRYSLT